MRLADGIEMLELPMLSFTGQTVIHPTLIWDSTTVVLVDTGFPGQLQQIRDAMGKAGVSFERLDKIIITHQDIDHIGNVADIIRESSHKIEMLSHVDERPYIEGRKPPVKRNPQNRSKMAELSDEQRRHMGALFANPIKADVDTTLKDGEILPYCGGIEVIFTPGHTPGHICLYLNKSKILIAGDELIVLDGELYGPDPRWAFDMDTALKSLRKLTIFDIETAICYHGGVYRKGVNRRIAELATLAEKPDEGITPPDISQTAE